LRGRAPSRGEEPPAEALGISARQDYLGSFRACLSGRFEPDAGATADHYHGLPKQFRLVL
jgi:hypothetical protein